MTLTQTGPALANRNSNSYAHPPRYLVGESIMRRSAPSTWTMNESGPRCALIQLLKSASTDGSTDASTAAQCALSTRKTTREKALQTVVS